MQDAYYSGSDREVYRGGDGGPINMIWISTDKKTLNSLHTYKQPMEDVYRGGDREASVNMIWISTDKKTLNSLHTYKQPIEDVYTGSDREAYRGSNREAYRGGDREAYRGGDREAYRGGDREPYRGGDGGPINMIWISTDKKILNALHTYKNPMEDTYRGQ